MQFSEINAKGLSKYWVAAGLDPRKLHIHITEVEPGSRSHAAHTHAGVEVFYVGRQATVEVEDELYPLGPNEAIVVDASRPHGIFNSGSTRVRYMVIIALKINKERHNVESNQGERDRRGQCPVFVGHGQRSVPDGRSGWQSHHVHGH